MQRWQLQCIGKSHTIGLYDVYIEQDKVFSMYLKLGFWENTYHWGHVSLSYISTLLGTISACMREYRSGDTEVHDKATDK